LLRNKSDIGKVLKVLIESHSKRSDDFLQGRSTTNKVVVFPKRNYQMGTYVDVKIEDCTGGTLLGSVID
jgi:tRNA-2-methylthio-N6-dimethylallyladenosine synthase